MMKNKRQIKGFSLIEVLIFVTVFSLFFVLAAAVMTTTLRITRQNQNKIRATHYAEDLKEWLDAEKEINWGGSECGGCTISTSSAFTQRVTQNALPATTSFCFNSPSFSEWPDKGTIDCNFDLDNQFRRIATFSATAPGGYVSQVAIDISVVWKEGEKLMTVPLKTVFSIWE